MTESLSRPTSPDGSEDLAMNFVFESDVDKDIDDVVRFGAFGQFEKARSIVDESLGELDDKFFVAVEIMRLLYDQGDGMELIKYTRRLLSPDRDRNTHGSWSEMATCILHLMHDFGVILEDDPSGFVTDEVDLSTFNWPVQQFQGLDDERMLCLVLMLMAIYLTPESLGRSPVGLHSIPSSLRHERVLSELLEHLLNIRHYWAAVNILRACFSLSHVDCKAIWTSIESFVDDSSSDDDEPALLFRLGALQTFMEGLLYCDFRDPSEARRPWPSWEELMDKFHILRRSLELHCGADTWTTSQTCLRHRILNIDREVQDRSYQSRRSSDKDRKAYKKLSELRMCAETNADRRVLKGILWRTDILVSEKGSESTRHPRGTFGVPFGIYSRYHALPRGMIDVVQHDKMHSSVMFKRDDPAVPSASQLIASPSWPSPLSIHEHIVRLAEFFSIGRVFSVLWTEATRADEGDSGYGSTLSGPSDHLEKPLMDARRRFVVVEASRDFCRALPITTYTGLGVAKAGVVKSDHAIIYTGARPPEPQDNERPRRDRRETGMRLVPIRVRLDSADYKLDPMSRVNFRDVHQIPHEARVRSLGRVSRQSIDALLSQYSNVWQDQAALGPCKADSDEPRAREDVDVHGDDGDGDENSDDGQDYESDDRWKGQS